MTAPAVAKALDEALDRLMVSQAPLAQRLDDYARILRDLNQPFAEAVDRLVLRLGQVNAGSASPQVGDTLPAFLLPDTKGRLLSLEKLLEAGPLVIAFRRGHWCPYCQLSTKELTRIHESVVEKGAGMVVISPEREGYAKELQLKAGSSFPILSDIDNGYALSLGLAISVGEEMREFMTRRGRDLGAYQGNDAWILPIPATFVLDRSGMVVFRHVDADYRQRASSNDILAAIDGLGRR